MPLLREKLLAGRRIALAGAPPAAIAEDLAALDAELVSLEVEELPSDEEQAGEWARARAPLSALVYCAANAFGDGGEARLRSALDEAWAAVREVATGALIPAGSHGKLVLIAPRPDAGPLAGAVRAGLENLVRTLAVEWARYGLTAVLLAPGPDTTDQELAQLTCFVVSEAGDYLSGCRLELGTVA